MPIILQSYELLLGLSYTRAKRRKPVINTVL